jgi:hypothetical protein
MITIKHTTTTIANLLCVHNIIEPRSIIEVETIASRDFQSRSVLMEKMAFSSLGVATLSSDDQGSITGYATGIGFLVTRLRRQMTI